MDVHPVNTFVGLVDQYVASDVVIGRAPAAGNVVALFLRRTDEAGAVVVELRNGSGGALALTLNAGQDSASVTGSVGFALDEDIVLRVTAADGSSQNLSGSFTFDDGGVKLTEVSPVPTIVGLAQTGINYVVGRIGAADAAVTRIFLRRTDNVGELTARLKNQAGQFIELTLGTGVKSGVAFGNLLAGAGEDVTLEFTAVDNASMNVGGSFTTTSDVPQLPFLTTLTKVKRWLQMPEADAGKDAILNDLIAGVSAMMQRYMGRGVVQLSTIGEVHRVGHGWDSIIPDHHPLLSVQQLRYEGDAVLAADYAVQAGLIEAVSGGSNYDWPSGRYEIDYTHGYAAVPDDLELAATAEVAMAYSQTDHGGGRLGREGEVFQDQTDARYRTWNWQPLTRQTMNGYRV